ncbi:MAG: electron transfer flavoprotein subunit beta, partial [Spirochaetes bacterium]
GPYDVLLFGKQAIDGDTAQVGPEVAGFLGVPVISFVTDVIEVSGDGILLERATDEGREKVYCDYPLAITVVKAGKRLRMPTLKGVLRSLKAEVGLFTHEMIDVEVDRCGLKGSPTRVKKVFSPEIRSKVRFIEGSVGEKAREAARIIKEIVG